MYTVEPLPRELERYVREAHRMRSEYIASLLKKGIAAVYRVLRGRARRRVEREVPVGGSFARR